MTEPPWIFLVWIAIFQLLGCSTVSTVGVDQGSERAAFVKKHAALARDYESSGALHLALQEWLAVSAVLPGAPDPDKEIKRLRKSISAKVAIYERLADISIAKSDYDTAQLKYLKALAVQPDNQGVIQRLKKLDAKIGYAGLASIPRASGTAPHADYEPTRSPNTKVMIGIEEQKPATSSGQIITHPSPNDSEGTANLDIGLKKLREKQYAAALDHFMLAKKLKETSDEVINKHIAAARKLIAEQHYAKGVSAFRMASYELAVTEFKKALEYDPQNQKARLYLGSAREMQMRLAE
jgi:tetratricopeptide (TPR) repeat protein